VSLDALTLVLASAVLHASWNLVVKASSDRLVAAFAQVTMGALAFAPFLLFVDVPWEAWPWFVASSLVHLAYGLTLVGAYERADLSLVYPVARGAAPVLVTVLAALVLDDVPSAAGLVAIAFVISGVLFVAQGSSRSGGMRWALATGALIATYTLIDASAVRRLDSAFGYTVCVFLGNAAVYVPTILRLRGARLVRSALRREGGRHLAAGTASALAYVLVLAVARLAPLGLVAAFRETSVVFGALGAWLLLGEHHARRRLLGAVLIAAGLAVLVGAG
jgi:drug/metabolite transporter (DMT)-like permease